MIDLTRISSGDTQPPSIVAPGNRTAEATGPDGAIVSYNITAADSVSAALDVMCVPASGSLFALGTTSVDCSVTDGAGNRAKATFGVTVGKI